MAYNKAELADLLEGLDFGSSVAESDNLLEVARVETSAFTDVLNDKVDLIPGTKGSGKSALFRIFVDFLPDHLLKSRKVVVAHGVENPGDPVFLAFKDQFEKLDESEFVAFWCIYLVSLAHERFIKGTQYSSILNGSEKEVEAFQRACQAAKIPEIKARKSLREILQWALHVLSTWSPKLRYKIPDAGEIELDLFGKPIAVVEGNAKSDVPEDDLPQYMTAVKEALIRVLHKSQVSIWLLIDRLDEIFPRRSELETRALRGLLRAMRIFSSPEIRVKVFLRDDMLNHAVRGGVGFTALTHVTARAADTLRWSEDQILTMIVKRIGANKTIASYFGIDRDRLDASFDYRKEVFYKIFPPTARRGERQSSTKKWIYGRCADGRGVVTPRDVIDLLTRAKQKQQDDYRTDQAGNAEWLVGREALQYGLDELSKRKRLTYLEAEFPHLWEQIKKFVGGKTEYDESALRTVLGKDCDHIIEDLVSIGIFSKAMRDDERVYWIPFLYRAGLELTQGRA